MNDIVSIVIIQPHTCDSCQDAQAVDVDRLQIRNREYREEKAEELKQHFLQLCDDQYGPVS